MMKCRLFSALLLLFTLMAAGCSGQPAAVTADDLADQVYIYEKEGFGSDFYIALNSDGSMRCSEGALSSYFGLGTWKLDGDTVILTTDDEKFVNRFAVEDRTLVYQSADSTGFMYLTVSDGEKFLPSGAPVGSLDIDEGYHDAPTPFPPGGRLPPLHFYELFVFASPRPR